MWRSQAIVLWVLMVVSLAVFLATVSATGSEGALAVARESAEGVCAPCHTCENPTRENPCLRTCPRSVLAPIIAESTTDRAPRTPPDVVMLDDLEDLYLPVPFDHKGHASMSEMMTGCQVCHHHSPEGEDNPACRSCHSAAKVKGDIRMPGLRGAYHRQCLNCHLEWSHDTACSACHMPKVRPEVCAVPDSQPDVANAIARMSKPVKLPETYVYNTSYSPLPLVTFHHGDHAQTFVGQCVECHHGDSCSRCHDRTRSRRGSTARGPTSGLKTSCLSCHSETNCGHCHDQSKRPRFDHAVRTGWSLEPHHNKLPCAECHGRLHGFAAPSTNCHACHARHRAASAKGLVAAAAHALDNMECLQCHADVNDRLARATTIHGPIVNRTGCTTCHDLSAASPRPAAERQRQLCLGCHTTAIDTGRGRVLMNIAALLSDNPNHHGPVRDGDCTACHNPHCSEHAFLLSRNYTPGLYASFDLRQYALCFGCHDENMVMSESGTAVTGFRDGDRNLHRLHVNRDKGRSCRVCHEVHASARPFHIRQRVPFGDSNWSLTINFEQTASGGTCAPGCHAPKFYDRTRAVRPTGPRTMATDRAGGQRSQDAAK